MKIRQDDMPAEACPNLQRNLQRCPCVYQAEAGIWCKFRGFCCGCVFNSLRYKTLPDCVSAARLRERRDAKAAGKPALEVKLPELAPCDLPAENRLKCPCGADAPEDTQCDRKGWCCECMANHYAAGSLPTCFRQMVEKKGSGTFFVESQKP
jgi:hypothetical protein